MSVCPSDRLWYCIKTNKASVMISSPTESPKTLVFANIRFSPKFERGHGATENTGVEKYRHGMGRGGKYRFKILELQ